MKSLLLSAAIILSLSTQGQTNGQLRFRFVDVGYDSTKICGVKGCLIPSHNTKQAEYIEPDGVPIYGLQGALVGVYTKVGFIATKRRDHLVGKPADLAMLNNPPELAKYVNRLLFNNPSIQ
jgi:hypothetical protein